MDLFFISVTIVFIFFLIIGYYLNVIRLSAPLILIYLVFCFSYTINNDLKNEKAPTDSTFSEENNYKQENNIDVLPNKENFILENSKDKNFGKEKIKEISKPIVSFNPKPIVIDSNLQIKKDLEKNKVEEIDLKKDEVKIIKEENNNPPSTLRLKEIMICRGVYKRNPIKPGFKFTNNVDSLFCYTKISNSGPKQEIKHVWYYQDKLITAVVYNIKTSYNYRSWSRKNISSSQVGLWRVDIIDSKDQILGSREFEISPLNDLY